MSETDKYWIDTEFTIIHIFFAIVLGVLIGGWFWVVSAIYIILSFKYLFKRLNALPRDYLKVKRGRK